MMNLKVQIDDKGTQKKMRFTSGMTVWEAVKEIQQKLEHEGEDHGLFLPHIDKIGQLPKWLEANRTLEYYDLKSDVILFNFINSHNIFFFPKKGCCILQEET